MRDTTEQTTKQIAEAKTIEEKIRQIKEKWKPHLEHQLVELQGKIFKKTMQKLQAYEVQTREKYGLGALGMLFLLHHTDKSIVELGQMLHMHYSLVSRIFDRLNMPRLSSKEASIRYMKSLPIEVKREQAKRARLALVSITPEQRKANGRKGALLGEAALTPEQKEQRRERLRQRWKAMSPVEQRNWMMKMRLAITPEKRREASRRAGLIAASRMTLEQKRERTRKGLELYTPEQRRERGRQRWLVMSPEKKREIARKGLLASIHSKKNKPNKPELMLIQMLQELGIYAEGAATAQEGQVFYASSKENLWHARTANGKIHIPDFKVKGLDVVFEIYGSYWHSRQRCKPLGLPEDTWNSEKKQAIYAEMGIVCKVYWDYELKDPIRREEIKWEVITVIAEARARAQIKLRAA